MIYVKFDTDNKSTEMRTDVDFVDATGYTQVSDDSMFGKRLLKSDTGVREFTKAEYDAEAAELDKKQKATVIDNMARELLKDSTSMVEPDFYEGLADDKKLAIKTYRDALRNIAKQETYPEHVEFPEKPVIE
jgi:hypothetical protein